MIDKAGNSVLDYLVFVLQDGGKYGHAVTAIRDEFGNLRYGIVDNRGWIVLPYDFDRVTIFSEWDDANKCWQERGIAVRNGKVVSFDITQGRKQ